MDNNEIDKILDDDQQHRLRITAQDDKKEYSVLGYEDVPVPVPYADLEDDSRRLAVLERLLRKDVPSKTIEAFIAHAKADGRWN
ncbi:hypothetical protein [Allopusillimonas ginsengisoli]|uniref:hypothetical protein n=1 Tax=Allopusillimonas ginsengisoli TaxID=453575 RepID=UPI001021E0E0|nr:hypothetical protein [Allopusillimonas ginsengisoli]TEA79825.1 hypothetical protein ERE07_02480 [Allopusillimonas ginsengisoli]